MKQATASKNAPGQLLRRWRRGNDITQAALAKRIGGCGGAPSISLWEHGYLIPTFTHALAIEVATKGPDQIRVEAWGFDRKTAQRAAR